MAQSDVRPRALALLAGLARQGEPMPSNPDLAFMLGLTDTVGANRLLRRMIDAGEIRVTALTANTRRVEAPDGTWSLESAPWRGVATGRESLPQRKCLRCRQMFRPPHRGRFMHDICAEAVGQGIPA